MLDVAVLDDPAAAAAALEPMRSSLLAALAEQPASAAGVAARLGLPRQKVGYHLRALEQHGLVEEVGSRRHGGLVERVLAPTAAAYVISPATLGTAGAAPERVADRLSAGYLLAVAARAVREVGALIRHGNRVATLSLDTEIRFASAAERAAFADELAATVRDLARRYHDESAAGGRWYRFVAIAHPRPKEHP